MTDGAFNITVFPQGTPEGKLFTIGLGSASPSTLTFLLEVTSDPDDDSAEPDAHLTISNGPDNNAPQIAAFMRDTGQMLIDIADDPNFAGDIDAARAALELRSTDAPDNPE